jgi:hypothetical protein
MKIREVAFNEYCRAPNSEGGVNRLRCGSGIEAFSSAHVDSIIEDAIGVIVTKTFNGRVYVSRYPWTRVTDVRYETVDVATKPSPKPQAAAEAPSK